MDRRGYKYTISNDVKTPNGTSVETWHYTSELTEADYDALVRNQEYNYPDVTVVRNPTTFYNCHSYAWYSTSSSNTHWMNDPQAYIDDKSYSYVTSTTDFAKIPSNVKSNSKALWIENGENSHSGLIWDVSSSKIISKWGPAGLYIHKQDYSPYYTSSIIK